jgi:hypothetical protein
MTPKPQAGSDWEVILTQAAGGHHRGEQPPIAREAVVSSDGVGKLAL